MTRILAVALLLALAGCYATAPSAPPSPYQTSSGDYSTGGGNPGPGGAPTNPGSLGGH